MPPFYDVLLIWLTPEDLKRIYEQIFLLMYLHFFNKYDYVIK